MNYTLKYIFTFVIIFLFFYFPKPLKSQQAPAADELTLLLNDFLKGASVNDKEAHRRFWAEDLIYTSSSGQRFGKEKIMQGLETSEEETDEPTTVYSADNIQIQQYGYTAIVAFRLVAETDSSDGLQTEYYLNSGTFLKRDGQWKVVNWQATRVPEN